MQTYLVGGAVRDRLLGLPVQDRDWVVVGATPDDMIAAGFKPVGRDFPVFLHPLTHEEHALARTERKTGAGYRGFAVDTSPHVTLEQDLERRDLTINAIAERPDGTLVDPFGGQRDLAQERLRHVSAAFVEDPVRLLRVARFAARFGDFTLAPETSALLRAMVEAGEVDALVAERVWQELARGLTTAAPARMFEVLADCGALARLLPEVVAGERLAAILDAATALGAGLDVRYACLFHGGAQPPDPARIAAVGERLRVPNDCRELADAVAREQAFVAGSAAATAAERLAWLERTGSMRRAGRLDATLVAAASIAAGTGGAADDAAFGDAAPLRLALHAALAVDTAAVAHEAAAHGARGPAVGEAIRAVRIAAIEAAPVAAAGPPAAAPAAGRRTGAAATACASGRPQ